MCIGKIVKSDSHINYVCQIYGPHEVEVEPVPADYAFGRFVRIALATGNSDESAMYLVGVIYDTQLLNPAFGTLGPRLSNEAQVEMFSPDYITEKVTCISILALGMLELHRISSIPLVAMSAVQGVPPLSPELGSEVEAMTAEEVQAFHLFSDSHSPDSPYLHMGYLPHVIAQRSSLLPQVTLRIIDQLEQLFPDQSALISIIKRNFAWRLKVETTG